MLFAQIPLLNSSASSSSATLILNADAFARSVFIFTQALMQNEATKSGKNVKAFEAMPELKKETKEQVHDRRERGRRVLIRQNNARQGLQKGQAGCRALKRPVKLLHGFTTTLLNKDESCSHEGQIWNTWHSRWGKGKTQAFGSAMGIP